MAASERQDMLLWKTNNPDLTVSLELTPRCICKTVKSYGLKFAGKQFEHKIASVRDLDQPDQHFYSTAPRDGSVVRHLSLTLSLAFDNVEPYIVPSQNADHKATRRGASSTVHARKAIMEAAHSTVMDLGKVLLGQEKLVCEQVDRGPTHSSSADDGSPGQNLEQ
ncbi:uncharacterized protein M421DRAFT_419588 [Didymella exigua CBS 183.55]|uniref:Uncharacterized protein n=1 Tax=Didymella exigua CBS 183.55 TaxID=1150837 RepID=A0A6A5RN10_9PLEO|nr:uncharacterized protein M421DRAFT_419588 [Didymella exigua CBS 183.55]KAF1929811.1 hypothetical protein M421DRAFT_419588 [Didymella exigua CBS 183.55]